MYHILLVHPLIHIWAASTFWQLWTMLLRILVPPKISLKYLALNFCWYLPRSAITESYGNSIFSLSRNYHSVFHSAPLFTFPPTVCTGFPCLHILTDTCYYSFFLVVAILMNVKSIHHWGFDVHFHNNHSWLLIPKVHWFIFSQFNTGEKKHLCPPNLM